MPHTLHQLLPRFVSKTHDAFNTHNVVALQVKQAFQKCFENAFVYALMHAQCGGVNVRMAHMARSAAPGLMRRANVSARAIVSGVAASVLLITMTSPQANCASDTYGSTLRFSRCSGSRSVVTLASSYSWLMAWSDPQLWCPTHNSRHSCSKRNKGKLRRTGAAAHATCQLPGKGIRKWQRAKR